MLKLVSSLIADLFEFNQKWIEIAFFSDWIFVCIIYDQYIKFMARELKTPLCSIGLGRRAVTHSNLGLWIFRKVDTPALDYATETFQLNLNNRKFRHNLFGCVSSVLEWHFPLP